MQHPGLVQIVQCRDQLARHRDDLVGGKAHGLLCDQLQQVGTVDILKLQVGGFVFPKDASQLDDVGMVDRGKRAGLMRKGLQDLFQDLVAFAAARDHA